MFVSQCLREKVGNVGFIKRNCCCIANRGKRFHLVETMFFTSVEDDCRDSTLKLIYVT